MSPERILLTLSHLAAAQAGSRHSREARQAAKAWSLLMELRADIAGRPAQARAVAKALRGVSFLMTPLRGYRRAHHKRCNGRTRPAERKVSDAEIVRAVRTAPSIKVAAARLDVNRSTITRRLPTLMRHPVHGAALANVPSLQRSLARRREVTEPWM